MKNYIDFINESGKRNNVYRKYIVSTLLWQRKQGHQIN